MIISYIGFTVDPRNEEKTYWFTVKLRGYECTTLDVGFDKDGQYVSASGTFFSLDREDKEKAIALASKMVPNVVV